MKMMSGLFFFFNMYLLLSNCLYLQIFLLLQLLLKCLILGSLYLSLSDVYAMSFWNNIIWNPIDCAKEKLLLSGLKNSFASKIIDHNL